MTLDLAARLAPAEVRPAPDRRPPAMTWRPAPPQAPACREQPALDLRFDEDVWSADAAVGLRAGEPPQTQDRGLVTTVRGRWTARPDPSLPDAGEWGGALALAVAEALLAQRPMAQLNRWLAEDVLVAVAAGQRRRRPAERRPAARVAVKSVRIQHPTPAAAEAAVHLKVGQRSMAMALRLEAQGDRWICSALEV